MITGNAGQPGKGGKPGKPGHGDQNGKAGAAGAAGSAGNPGQPGNAGEPGAPGLPGGIVGSSNFGSFLIGGPGLPPQHLLQAPNVTSLNATIETPYAFTIEFTDTILIPETSVAGATVQVVPPGGTPITATLTNLTIGGTNDGVGDATVLTATYAIIPPSDNWTLAPDGVYTVQLTGSPVKDLAGNVAQQGPSGTFTNLAQPVQVVDGGNFIAQVIVPSEMSYDQPSLIYVQYSNIGTTAYPAPVLVMSAAQNGQDGAFLSLDPSLAGIAYNSNEVPSGFSAAVQFLASGAQAGILQPGETELVPLYYGGWLSGQFSTTQPINFSLAVLDTSNTGAIDWTTLGADLQPSSINNAAWNAILPTLQAQLGTTWGQYVQELDNDSAYLAQVNTPTTDVSKLLSFEVARANGDFAVPASATIAADALPAPGMDLTFTLSFQPTISGRNTQSIAGLGWTTNWDISATTEPNGDVSINLDGPALYFSLTPDGTYQIEDSDQGITLTQANGAYTLVDTDGTIYQFNANGSLDYVEDTNGNTITAGYNAQNQLVSLTHSNGEYIDLSYDPQGFVSSITDNTGATESFGYNANGQLTSCAGEFGTENYSYVTSGTNAQFNALAEISNSLGTGQFFSYNSAGRLTDTQANGGADNTQIAYLDGAGYAVTDALGNTSTVYLNFFGATAETIDALGNVTQYYYDANQNLIKVVGPEGSTSTYTYNANGNLTSSTDPLGLTTYYTYDANNNLTSYTDAMGNTTSYAYDSGNNLLSVTYANGASEQATYNPLGEATQFLDANGHAIGYVYNSRGLVTQETFANGTSYSYTYTADGDLTSATDADGNVTTFVYGIAAQPDLLTEVEYPDGTWLKFTYNAIGQRMQSVDQTGFTVNYTYNALGQLSELTDANGNLIVEYAYDNAGNVIEAANGNGTVTKYTYDADGDVLSITHYASAGDAVNSFDDYTYDAFGDVLTDTNQDGQWTYTYDADGQLTAAVFTPNASDPDNLPAENLQYVYNADGNRISETVNGVSTTYVSNNVNEYTSSTTNGVTTTYAYDNNGNLIGQTTGGSTTSYSYNQLNELTGVNSAATTASYAYDPLGNLISQTVNGTTTNYQVDSAGNIVAAFTGTGVYNNSGGLTAHYTYGLGLVSQTTAAAASGYYDFNNQGSTVGITGAGGTYQNRYAYVPFGKVTTISAGLANPFTFVGQYGVTDGGSGLFKMGLRDYDPAVGAFVSNDPSGLAGGDTNLRRYAANNAVNDIDPSGLGFGLPTILAKYSEDLAQAVLRAQEFADYLAANPLPPPNGPYFIAPPSTAGPPYTALSNFFNARYQGALGLHATPETVTELEQGVLREQLAERFYARLAATSTELSGGLVSDAIGGAAGLLAKAAPYLGGLGAAAGLAGPTVAIAPLLPSEEQAAEKVADDFATGRLHFNAGNLGKFIQAAASRAVSSIASNIMQAAAGAYAAGRLAGELLSGSTLTPLVAKVQAAPSNGNAAGIVGAINGVSTGDSNFTPQDQGGQTTTSGTLLNYSGGGYDNAICATPSGHRELIQQ